MTSRKCLPILTVIAAATPFAAIAQAPAGTTNTRYCMRVEAATGSHVERLRCWTRDKWAEQGVDIDKDWPREGVRTIG